MSDWKLTVGMEVHVELQTKTKMFCGCKNDPFHSKPNTNVCPVCYGLPGALPVANKKAVEMTVKLGQALKGKIAKTTFWARKNYFYPDLPKGYQISQSSAPLVEEATLTIDGHDHRIERIHLEEDAGKLIHASDKTHSLVNYNRAGVPLMELVTHPDFYSGETAKKFCKELQSILRKLDISTADMEKGLMRCEANISVSKTDELGTKVEVKNINSFKAVEKAIKYEYDRQTKVLDGVLENSGKLLTQASEPLITQAGEYLTQETRTWDADNNKTVVMRSKETSSDYRYFPEPDLPYVATILTEGEEHKLPDEMRKELAELGLSEDLARTVVSKGYFENITGLTNKNYAPQVSKLIIQLPEFSKLSSEEMIEFAGVASNYITKTQKEILAEVSGGKRLADVLVEYQQEIDLTPISKEVISENTDLAEKYKAGNENVLNALVGQVMKKTQGKANVVKVRTELEKQLKA